MPKRLLTPFRMLVFLTFFSAHCSDAIFTSSAAVASTEGAEIVAKNLIILTGQKSMGPEQKAAGILANRILKRSAVSVETVTENDSKAADLMEKADLVFVVGSPKGNDLSKNLMQKLAMTLPTLPNSDKTHPEGFAVKSGAIDGRQYIVIAGVDERGTLYGVGWVLRAMTYRPNAIVVPPMDACDKPAFWMRGAQPTGPGSRARQYGNLRPRTNDEHIETMEDLMLLGTNVFGGDPNMLHSYGMLTTFGRTANQMSEEFPKEWAADGGRSRQYVCPSIPEARKALLESFDKMFREAPDYDFFTTNSGDEGGCRCDKCMPWGGTYIRLMHEIADILHKYHPNTKILATNQDLTNEGDQEIIEYLNSGDSSWLYAIRYGPGADEMQTYIRGPVNPRWFEYEGFGPLGNYLKFMHHELPRTTNIALYTDITHWMQSQFAVQHPDVALAAVYSRRSWNARPRNFHRVAREIMHYAVGDIHYSEGMHDDFNKWFWYRMLWNPNQDAESITKEYCRYWFGPEAQDEAAQAIFLMEETLEKPVIGNPGIVKAVDLLRSAGKRIPENLRRIDYRWRIITQKALMDRYIQLLVERGEELKKEAGRILEQVPASGQPANELQQVLKKLEQPLETKEMKSVKEEATKLGEESNEIVGYRVPAVFIVDTLDLTEIGWWKKTLQEALDGGDNSKIRNAAKMVLNYEDPGEGGFYDNVGWPSEPEHLVHGETLWGFMPFPGPARRSHYNLAYTFGRGGRGVTFAYDNLDPDAEYVVRISVGVHRDEEEPSLEGVKLEEGLEADGVVISDGFHVSRGETTCHEFNIPHEVTKDGELKISLKSKSEFMPITALNEIWLMKKDKMPWTVR
ncbi:MAG: hypothetical protein ABIH23_34670 [bacterium]